jgi:hypothetical protein
MAPRAYWKSYPKLSPVFCPISVFPATSEREKINSTKRWAIYGADRCISGRDYIE